MAEGSPLFNNPISPEKADGLVRLLGLPEGARVLDAGCGAGEFLLRVVAASGAEGLGIDLDPRCIDEARARAQRLERGSCEFREGDMQAVELPDAGFDLAICLGSTHAFGSGEAAYPGALSVLSRVVRPGGIVLIGEGYWKRPPEAAYLELLGEPIGIYRDHSGNIAFAEKMGLAAVHALVSNDEEWDRFEWAHYRRARSEALGLEGAESRKKLERARQWRDGYLRWGRDTMGFGFYLFEKPPVG